MTPPDLHVVPREDTPSQPSNVAKLPPRPGPDTLMVRVDLRDRIDANQQDIRDVKEVVLRIEAVQGEHGVKIEAIDGRTERIEGALLQELPRLDYARAARDEVRALAEVVGKPPDVAALMHASHTDLSPEHVARLDREAKFGTGIFKSLSDLTIKVGQVERRALVGAASGATAVELLKHLPDLFAAVALGWPGVALLAVVLLAAGAVLLLRRKGA